MSAGKFGKHKAEAERKDRKKGKDSATKQGGIGDTLERYTGD